LVVCLGQRGRAQHQLAHGRARVGQRGRQVHRRWAVCRERSRRAQVSCYCFAVPDGSPESRDAYWARKHAELACLASLLADGEGALDASPPRTLDGLVQAKRRLRARLLARSLLTHDTLTESRFAGGLTPVVDGVTLSYRYQRYDLRVVRRH